MNEHEIQQHLSQIATQWSVLRQAHGGPSDEAAAARQLLMQRYCGAVFRYLLALVRDPSAAEDLTQEFALRFVEGRFGQADPAQGRFRNYVKGALFRLVQDHYRQRLKGPKEVPLPDDPAFQAPDEAAIDQAFRDSWRQELLARAWAELEQVEQSTGQPYHAVLRLRVERPELSSAEIGAELAGRFGKPFTQVGVRQLVHRARAKFAELLLADVRESMTGAAMAEVVEELAELNLLKYCQDAVDRRA